MCLFNKQSKIFLLLVIIVIFSSCVTSGKINYLQQPDHIIPTYKDTISFEDYKLKEGDRIFIKVYSTNEKANSMLNASKTNENIILSGTTSYSELYTYLINSQGCIVFPMIGELKIEGLTTREVKRNLEQILPPFISSESSECSVDVRIINRYFSVIGSNNSGRYPIIKEKMNIFQALAQAGDMSRYADRSKIRIIRETEQGTQIMRFDLRSADIIHSEYYYIEPNDVIYIQNVNGQFFSVTSFAGVISTIMSTLSFGLLIYNIFPKVN